MLCTTKMLQLYTTNLMPIIQTGHVECTTEMLGHALHRLEFAAKLKIVLQAPYKSFFCLGSRPSL